MGYRVLIPQDITEAGKNWLAERGYEIAVLQEHSVETICRLVPEYDAILARTAEFPREVMEAGSRLKVIARYGAGVDNIDLEAASEHGIQVCNAPLANSNSVAEHTVTLLLACAKNLIIQDRETRAGNFESRNLLKGTEVRGKTLGLIGCGHIGRLTAEKAAGGLGMQVIGYDAFLKKGDSSGVISVVEDLDELCRRADFISLHVPATPETYHLINREKLSLMKKTAVLINCSRGGVVDEAALYEALVQGVISGAGLDVFEEEPVKRENPLYTLENVIVTPHNAALTYEAMDQMGLDAARGIDEVLNGRRPTWPVNHI